MLGYLESENVEVSTKALQLEVDGEQVMKKYGTIVVVLKQSFNKGSWLSYENLKGNNSQK